MRFSSDWRSIFFIFLTLAVHVAAVTFAISFVFYPFWILISSVLSFSCCVINHNHIHTPLFKRKSVNRSLGVLLTLAKGHTSNTVIIPHNLNHHAYVGTIEHKLDWIDQSVVHQYPAGLKRLLFYVWKASRAMQTNRRLPEAKKLQGELLTQINLQKFALILFSGGLLLLNPWRFILWVVPPWIFSMLFLVAINLLQHDGCALDSDFNHSRNFTGRFANWIFFNNGYHTIHHIHPELHWTRLPAAHRQEVLGRIDAQLNERSILAFIFKKYVKK